MIPECATDVVEGQGSNTSVFVHPARLRCRGICSDTFKLAAKDPMYNITRRILFGLKESVISTACTAIYTDRPCFRHSERMRWFKLLNGFVCELLLQKNWTWWRLPTNQMCLLFTIWQRLLGNYICDKVCDYDLQVLVLLKLLEYAKVIMSFQTPTISSSVGDI